jgi:hypothetical protein
VKKKLSLTGSLLVLVALAITACSSTTGDKITVLNPAIEATKAERKPLVPRLDTLEGKKIYFVDIQWGGPDAAYSLFEEMQKWFAENMPTVQTKIRRVASGMVSDDPGLRKELTAEKADAAIVGVGG